MSRRALASLLVLVACSGGESTTADTATTSTTTVGSSGGSSTAGSSTAGSTATSTTDVPTTYAPTGTTGSSGDASAGSTGAPDLPPALTSTLITDMNRAYPEMHGGWGHHLRGLMRHDQGDQWFVVDAGESVLKNQSLRYFRRAAGEPAWSFVAEQAHTETVQQNAGSLLLGDLIYTYGVNVSQHWLEECYFQVTDPAVRACNAVTISGQVYATPVSSNYVGAAVLGDGARIVWFTVVGDMGGAGQLVYTYNYGGGWNGPVVSAIGAGGNDVGYIHAMAGDDGKLSLVAQTYYGAYPNGAFGAAVADLDPGQPVAFLELVPPAPNPMIRSSADLYLDADSGAAHALAHFDGDVAYYHRPGGDSWASHLEPLYVFPDTYRARFVRPAGGPLWIVRGGISGQGTTLHRAPAGPLADAVDWAAADTYPVDAPAAGFGSPTAIYVESPTYQRTPVGGLNFALCGEYQVADHAIHHLVAG